ncbi:MAG: carboxypeptidase regulatory-like domain-containing protein [Ignavibacteriae bacterium]|nr:carboxypeptidase regulatory-like domain-containing protein [Ignavibacteriota bacterium]
MQLTRSLFALRLTSVIGAIVFALILGSEAQAQGVTTASLTGMVRSDNGEALVGANVIATHEPSGTRYGASTRVTGQYNIPNMRIGGPYTITISYVGYKTQSQSDIYLSLGQEASINFDLVEETITGKEVVVTAERDEVLNSGRTGAETYVGRDQVTSLPSIKRSTRDLTRLDPRSDGNFSFGGRNWLYNNISLDGSYFNNPYGLDDPAPGGQANAEPVPFDAVDQVQISVAPFDVRQGGFSGAGINTVTKSGTNQYRASLYSFIRSEDFVGNTVAGKDVIANPSLSFNQSGFTVSGPIMENKLFLFINGELERRDDPGTNFVASRNGSSGFGISRVDAATMDAIRQRMIQEYQYDPGTYEGYVHETNNEKLLAKLDWNIDDNHNLTFRYNLLDARRELPPHPFVLSFGGTGRGPNENSLPFYKAGYRINNQLSSYALEVNSRFEGFANRFFASYNRFRDFREPFSEDFPTIEIGEGGVTYTTIGHEPFSIHNVLDQDVWQFTNNLSYFSGSHVITVGVNYEQFHFFNSFNIFRHGLFGLPFAATTFASIADFMAATDPLNPSQIDFRGMIGTGPFKGEDLDVGQLGIYAQDEYLISPTFNVTLGLRVDFPIYITEPVDNPFSKGLNALDENGQTEVVDQSKFPDATPLFSPRVGFNWNVTGDRSTQVRGGTGLFTGRLPFVWLGNQISNPGQNPNLPAHLRSFDVNSTVKDFKWPQVWTTNAAIDHKLPWDVLGTLEVLYSKDVNAVYVRNADLVAPVRTLPDGRPYYGGAGASELNPDFGAGIYILDNTDEGYNYTITAQLRKQFDFGLNASVAYTNLEAKNQLKSTEIASVLWAENPVQGNPNQPGLNFSEFGNRHRITGVFTYRHTWSDALATNFGVFFEVAEGNRFAGAGGNRYSYVYSGDVNGDGMAGNDLIYIPRDANDIILMSAATGGTELPKSDPAYAQLFAFINQDEYLSEHKGEIAERFGAVNAWFSNIDLKILQDISFEAFGSKQTVQLNLDILNVANLINSDWGVRQVATTSALAPLRLNDFGGPGQAPRFYFTGVSQTFINDPGLFSRWQAQFGIRYIFN